MTSSPSTLPPYVTMDVSSPWHTSALQATALESVTLPARVRPAAESRTTLADMEVAFNNHGNRKIASLGMSLADPSQLEEQTRITDEEDLDVSLLPSSPQGPQRLGSRAHLFGSAEALRGPWRSEEDVEGANMESRDRFHSGPTIHRLVIHIQCHFPRINQSNQVSNHPALPTAQQLPAHLLKSVAKLQQCTARRSYVFIDVLRRFGSHQSNVQLGAPAHWLGGARGAL